MGQLAQIEPLRGAEPDHAAALHLGAFDQSLEGWTNTDVTGHLYLARIPLLPRVMGFLGMLQPTRAQQHRRGVFRKLRYLDVTRRFPFEDGEFRYVYSSHMLEHLTPGAAQHCLRESYRVLGPGGALRIAVPDLDQVMAGYDPADPNRTLDLIFELGSRRSKNRHWWMYNATSLVALLRQVGFQKAYRCPFGFSEYARLMGIDNRPDSLIVEAVK